MAYTGEGADSEIKDISKEQEEAFQHLFSLCDKDDNGTIDTEEFMVAMYELGIEMSHKDVELLVHTLDRDGNGLINFEEFLRGISQAGPIPAIPCSAVEQWCERKAEHFRRAKAKQIFRYCDKDGNGVIDRKELQDVIVELGLILPSSSSAQAAVMDRLLRQFRHIKDGEGINEDAFCDGFVAWMKETETSQHLSAVNQRNGDNKAEGDKNNSDTDGEDGLAGVVPPLPEISSAGHLGPEQIAEYKRAFDLLDNDGSGTLDQCEMHACLRLLGHDLSEQDVKFLMSKLDSSGDGRIDFEEFLRGIGMIETLSDASRPLETYDSGHENAEKRLREKIDLLRKSKRNLEQRCNALEAEVAYLEGQNQRLQHQLTAVQERLDAQGDRHRRVAVSTVREVKDLQRENEMLQRELERAITAENELKKRNRDLTTSANEFQRMLNDLTAQVYAREEEIARLRAQLASVSVNTPRHRALEEEIRTARATIDELFSERQRLEQQVAELAKTNTRQTKELKDLQELMHELRGTIDQLQGGTSTALSAATASQSGGEGSLFDELEKAQAGSRNHEMEQLRRAVDTEKAAAEAARAERDAKHYELLSIRDKMSKMDEECTYLRDENMYLREAQRSLEVQLIELQHGVETATVDSAKQKAEFEKYAHELRGDNARLMNEVAERDTTIASLQQRIAQLEEDNKAHDLHIAQLLSKSDQDREHIDHLSAQLQASLQRYEELSKASQDRQEENARVVDILQQQLVSQEKQITELSIARQRDIAQLEGRLVETHLLLETTQHALVTSKREVETANTRAVKAEAEREALEREFAPFKESHNTIVSEQAARIATLEQQLEALRREIAESKSQKDKEVAAPPEPNAPWKIVFEGVDGEINDEEKAIVRYVNHTLKNDVTVSHHIPIGHRLTDVASAFVDGVLLCKLINYAVPGTIDERVLKLTVQNLNDITDNFNLCINSAKAIGCAMAAQLEVSDLVQANTAKILRFVYEILRTGVLSKVNIARHKALVKLADEASEDISVLTSQPPEEILLRWFNYHLKKASCPLCPLANFGDDLKDGIRYCYLLQQVCPEECGDAVSVLHGVDDTTRVERVLQYADKLQCNAFIEAKDILSGNPKLNLLFVACLFDARDGLGALEARHTSKLAEIAEYVATDGTREERALMHWMANLGVPINNIVEDVRDGIALLKAIDKMSPGLVQWSRIRMDQTAINQYKKLENTSYVVELCRQLRIPVINIGGKDIYDGNRKLILAIMWQLMQYHIFSVLKSLKFGSGGRELTDADIVAWANQKVASANKTSRMKSFKDPSLRTGLFLIDLLAAVRPGSVDYSLVTAGDTEELSVLNAKYAISIARKIGCCVFCMWEDVVEVRPKMILTFVGALMLAGTNIPR